MRSGTMPPLDVVTVAGLTTLSHRNIFTFVPTVERSTSPTGFARIVVITPGGR
jgi:hypothetical protein